VLKIRINSPKRNPPFGFSRSSTGGVSGGVPKTLKTTTLGGTGRDSRGRWWSWNSATTSAAELRDDRNIVCDFRKRWKEKNVSRWLRKLLYWPRIIHNFGYAHAASPLFRQLNRQAPINNVPLRKIKDYVSSRQSPTMDRGRSFIFAILFPTAARHKNCTWEVVNPRHFVPMHPQVGETNVRTLTGKSANKSFDGLKSSHYREIRDSSPWFIFLERTMQ